LQYDEIRKSLCDEVFQRIEDTITISSLDMAMQLLKPEDENLLRIISKLGPISHYIANKELGENAKEILVRCKSRNLVMPVLKGTHHHDVELTTLGRQVLEALDNPKPKDSKEVKAK